jgi:hypothetical protein
MTSMMYTYDDFMMISMRLNRNVYKVEDEVMRRMNVVRKTVGLPIHEVIKKTVIQKTDAAQVIKVLNKMSEKNYEKLKAELFEMLEPMEDEEELDKVTRTLFTIASTNIFYSALFSKLYVELIPVKRIFFNLFQDHFDVYMGEFQKVEYVSPNKDYDQYCEYNKKMDQMKSMLMFFVNLMKKDVCKLDNMSTMCMMFVQKVLQILAATGEAKEQAEELMNCLHLVLKECGDLLVFHHQFEALLGNVQKVQAHPNVNSKIKFKCMDIRELASKL